MENHKENVIAKLEEKLAKVKSGEIPTTVDALAGDPICPTGYYYDKETNKCILNIG